MTATATDSLGLPGTAQIGVTVTVAANAAPVVTITSPADGSSFVAGQTVSFSGGASDAEDGDLTAGLAWSSDLDGSIGSGAGFSTASLSVGSHIVTATATDSLGLPGTAQIGVTVTGGGDATIVEYRVSARSDDAEERPGGSVTRGSTDLELVYDGGGNQTVGLRFNGVAIPQGTTIASAFIQFQVDEPTSVDTSLTIEGEDSDNAPTFRSKYNISSRSRTAASVSWAPVPWTIVGQAGPDQRTSDIATIIQEIVNRPGWSSGNSLVIIVSGTGERVAESFDGNKNGAPLLHVEF